MHTTPETLHICGYGKKLKKLKNMLVVKWNEGDEEKSISFTSSRLKHVILSGEHLISTGAIRLLFENKVALSYIDDAGNPIGYIFSHERCRHVDIWEKQINLNTSKSLQVAKHICKAAARNKVSILLSLQKSRKLDMRKSVLDMRSVIIKMDIASDNEELMGLEGSVSKLYFSSLVDILPHNFYFTGRKKYPSVDIVNAMLSYGYGILYSKIRHAVISANLNPYQGVLHASYRDNEALVYDLIEEFRQPVVDKVVLTMIGRKQVCENDYVLQDKACLMNDYFKKKFANEIFMRLESKTKYENRKETFEKIIMKQALKFRAFIFDSSEYLPFIFR